MLKFGSLLVSAQMPAPIALCILLAAVAAASSTECHVATTGVDSDSCCAESSPCNTLNRALRNAGVRAVTVAVHAGAYRVDPVEISGQNVTIRGVGSVQMTAHAAQPSLPLLTFRNSEARLFNLQFHDTANVAEIGRAHV